MVRSFPGSYFFLPLRQRFFFLIAILAAFYSASKLFCLRDAVHFFASRRNGELDRDALAMKYHAPVTLHAWAVQKYEPYPHLLSP